MEAFCLCPLHHWLNLSSLIIFHYAILSFFIIYINQAGHILKLLTPDLLPIWESWTKNELDEWIEYLLSYLVWQNVKTNSCADILGCFFVTRVFLFDCFVRSHQQDIGHHLQSLTWVITFPIWIRRWMQQALGNVPEVNHYEEGKIPQKYSQSVHPNYHNSCFQGNTHIKPMVMH